MNNDFEFFQNNYIDFSDPVEPCQVTNDNSYPFLNDNFDNQILEDMIQQNVINEWIENQRLQDTVVQYQSYDDAIPSTPVPYPEQQQVLVPPPPVGGEVNNTPPMMEFQNEDFELPPILLPPLPPTPKKEKKKPPRREERYYDFDDDYVLPEPVEEIRTNKKKRKRPYEGNKRSKKRRVSRVKKTSLESEEYLMMQQHRMVRNLIDSRVYNELSDVEAKFVQGKGNGNFELKRIVGSNVCGIILKPSRTKWWKSYVLRISGLEGDMDEWDVEWLLLDTKYPNQGWTGKPLGGGDPPLLKIAGKDKNMGVARFNLKFHFIIKGANPSVTKDSIMMLSMLVVKNEQRGIEYYIPFICSTYEDGGKDYKNEFKKIKTFPMLVFKKNRFIRRRR